MSKQEADVGTQVRNLDARTEAEAMKEYLLQACSLWLVQPSYTTQNHLLRGGGSTTHRQLDALTLSLVKNSTTGVDMKHAFNPREPGEDRSLSSRSVWSIGAASCSYFELGSWKRKARDGWGRKKRRRAKTIGYQSRPKFKGAQTI